MRFRHCGCRLHYQGRSNFFASTTAGIEPPPELEDEDEMLADLYEHACSQQRARNARAAPSALLDTSSEEEFDWVWDVDLVIDGERDGMDVDR